MREPVTTIGWLFWSVGVAAGGAPGGWASAGAGQAAMPAAMAKVALPKRSFREILFMTRASPAGRARGHRGPVRPTGRKLLPKQGRAEAGKLGQAPESGEFPPIVA